MKPIYNYGLSQEDALSEYRALDLKKEDRLLCVASGGEIPLNLLALSDIALHAVDISIGQLNLTKLKLHAVCSLESHEAAGFLGFTDISPVKRLRYFNKTLSLMDDQEKSFWARHPSAIQNGVIHCGRFENYITKFSRIGRKLLGENNLRRLLDCQSIHEQKTVFDRYLNSGILRFLFKLAFHPRIYKNRGIDSTGLIHSGEHNIADFFYSRFKNFCCATLARKNYYFQYTFFNQILYSEALPEYLTEPGMNRIRRQASHITFQEGTYTEALLNSIRGQFNKFHLSNIGDWMNRTEFADLLQLLQQKTLKSSKAVLRYIHLDHPIPRSLIQSLTRDDAIGKMLEKTDRYPFYSIVPIQIKGRSS